MDGIHGDIRWSKGQDKVTVPLGTAESEAVGELPLQGSPELLTLLLGKLEKVVVVALELVVLLDDLGVSGVGLMTTAAVVVVTATLAATATTTALLYHTNTSVSIRQTWEGEDCITTAMGLEHGKVRGGSSGKENVGVARTLKCPPRPMFERFAIEDRWLCPVAILNFGSWNRIVGRKKSDMRTTPVSVACKSRLQQKPKPQT